MRFGPHHRDRDDYQPHASRRHRLIGDILSHSIFRRMTVLQEYPITNLIKGYANHRHRVDWYIRDLNLIIEIQGEQHESPVYWGEGEEEGEATRRFKKQVISDVDRLLALRAAGYMVIEIEPGIEPTKEWLLEKIEKESTAAEQPPDTEMPQGPQPDWAAVRRRK